MLSSSPLMSSPLMSTISGHTAYQLTFSECNTDSFLDWDLGSFTSHLIASYSMPDNIAWSQTPYVMTFIRQSDSSDETNTGGTVNIRWNWANAVGPKVSRGAPIYHYRSGSLVSVNKYNIRGKGKAIQIEFNSDGVKDFQLNGWAVWTVTNVSP